MNVRIKNIVPETNNTNDEYNSSEANSAPSSVRDSKPNSVIFDEILTKSNKNKKLKILDSYKTYKAHSLIVSNGGTGKRPN